jgi:hypothetical protein
LNNLILTDGRNLELLSKWAPAQAYFINATPFEALMIEGIEVVNKIDPEWVEVVIADSLAASSVAIGGLPRVGMGNQLHQLNQRQGDVWYRLGIPTWRLAPTRNHRFVWGLFGANGLLKSASLSGMEWVMEPLARYLIGIGFVGPMGVWVTKRITSKYVIAIDYGKAYNEWLATDTDLKATVKELISA